MKQLSDFTPAALYARVSSDRQDVDLSVAAQMRALRDYAERNSYSVDRDGVLCLPINRKGAVLLGG